MARPKWGHFVDGIQYHIVGENDYRVILRIGLEDPLAKGGVLDAMITSLAELVEEKGGIAQEEWERKIEKKLKA